MPSDAINHGEQGNQVWDVDGTINFRTGYLWNILGVAVAAVAAELNYVAGVVAGTVQASKALVADANKAVDHIRTAALHLGTSGSETLVTATGTELNTLADAIASVTTVATPASGTCGVQFTFKNAAGNAVGSRRAMQAFICDSNGDLATAATGLAVLTNGKLVELKTGQVALVETTAAGLLGITLTASAGSYYLAFVTHNGTIIKSTVLTVN